MAGVYLLLEPKVPSLTSAVRASSSSHVSRPRFTLPFLDGRRAPAPDRLRGARSQGQGRPTSVRPRGVAMTNGLVATMATTVGAARRDHLPHTVATAAGRHQAGATASEVPRPGGAIVRGVHRRGTADGRRTDDNLMRGGHLTCTAEVARHPQQTAAPQRHSKGESGLFERCFSQWSSRCPVLTPSLFFRRTSNHDSGGKAGKKWDPEWGWI